MKESSIYTYNFTNGLITVSRGVKTRKYDWFLEISLKNDKEGNKQFICLDKRLFMTMKGAKQYATELLTKYKLM